MDAKEFTIFGGNRAVHNEFEFGSYFSKVIAASTRDQAHQVGALFILQQAEYANRRIIMLEPRRLAAKSIAAYLASQLNETVGQTVGYQIRFEQQCSAQTRLLIVTEGVLVRKIQQDPALTAIDLLIFDGFHERSLYDC